MLLLPQNASREPIRDFAEAQGCFGHDLAIFTDGSGGGEGYPLGWSAVLAERGVAELSEIHGGQSAGTPPAAELLPVAAAISWHAERRLARRRAGRDDGRVLAVVVFSDNLGMTQTGGDLVAGRVKLDEVRDRLTWATILAAIPIGYSFRFVHVARNSVALNWYVDQRARECFRVLGNLTEPPISAAECNPGPGR